MLDSHGNYKYATDIPCSLPPDSPKDSYTAITQPANQEVEGGYKYTADLIQILAGLTCTGILGLF